MTITNKHFSKVEFLLEYKMSKLVENIIKSRVNDLSLRDAKNTKIMMSRKIDRLSFLKEDLEKQILALQERNKFLEERNEFLEYRFKVLEDRNVLLENKNRTIKEKVLQFYIRYKLS